MKNETEIKEFISKFEYKEDKKGIIGGQWRILDSDDPKGDCEDFALTVAWIMNDRSMWKLIKSILRKDVQIWTGVSKYGERHAMLRADVNNKWMWIDNIYKFWMLDTADNKMEKPYKPVVVFVELVNKKITLAAFLIAVGLLGGYIYDQLI